MDQLNSSSSPSLNPFHRHGSAAIVNQDSHFQHPQQTISPGIPQLLEETGEWGAHLFPRKAKKKLWNRFKEPDDLTTGAKLLIHDNVEQWRGLPQEHWRTLLNCYNVSLLGRCVQICRSLLSLFKISSILLQTLLVCNKN